MSDPLPASLTPRQLEVLRLVKAGLTDGEIARLLFISVRTARMHQLRIADQFGI